MLTFGHLRFINEQEGTNFFFSAISISLPACSRLDVTFVKKRPFSFTMFFSSGKKLIAIRIKPAVRGGNNPPKDQNLGLDAVH